MLPLQWTRAAHTFAAGPGRHSFAFATRERWEVVGLRWRR